MIPKVIHYTWFSGDEMPPKIKDCIASWKRVLPNYELRLWDMDAINKIDSQFLTEALSTKKWAYAADYVRLYALYYEGGIYLDTDVIVYHSFDELLSNKAFIGKEGFMHFTGEHNGAQYLSSHCMGAEKGNLFIQNCLEYYENRHFILSNNNSLPLPLRYNYVLLPYIQAVIARNYGYNWDPRVQSIQYCKDGLVIYPSNYFCGGPEMDFYYCIHLAAGSWRDEYNFDKRLSTSLMQKFKYKFSKILKNFLLSHSYALVKTDRF